jgi:prephenate dehydrogenase
VRGLLESGSDADLHAWQQRAAADRGALLEASSDGGPARELGISVPNRPGVIAELALALAREGIGITDLSLTPSADGTRGYVALWVREDRAARAVEVLAERGFAVA